MAGLMGMFIVSIFCLFSVMAFAPWGLRVSRMTQCLYGAEVETVEDRKKLWKEISQLDRDNVDYLDRLFIGTGVVGEPKHHTVLDNLAGSL